MFIPIGVVSFVKSVLDVFVLKEHFRTKTVLWYQGCLPNSSVVTYCWFAGLIEPLTLLFFKAVIMAMQSCGVLVWGVLCAVEILGILRAPPQLFVWNFMGLRVLLGYRHILLIDCYSLVLVFSWHLRLACPTDMVSYFHHCLLGTFKGQSLWCFPNPLLSDGHQHLDFYFLWTITWREIKRWRHNRILEFILSCFYSLVSHIDFAKYRTPQAWQLELRC